MPENQDQSTDASPEALKYSNFQVGQEGELASACYERWRKHYSMYELESAQNHIKHFLNESDVLDDKKQRQTKSGETVPTYYTPLICPALLTRAAVLLDAFAQANPLVTFKAVANANPEIVALQEAVVNHDLLRDDVLVKQYERILDAGLFSYSATKCYLEEVTKNTMVDPKTGYIVTGSGKAIPAQSYRDLHQQIYGEELTDEDISRFVRKNPQFAKQTIELRPTHENIPNGRFIYDPTQKDKKWWRFAGDIQLVSYASLLQHADEYDPSRIGKLGQLLRSGTAGSGQYSDFWKQIMQVTNTPEIRDEDNLLAICEMYVKVIEKSQVKIKRLRVCLNVNDPEVPKSGKEQLFALAEAEDSPFSLVEFPYVQSYDYKMPHQLHGISTTSLMADLADQYNDQRNLSIAQAKWTLFPMILVRQGNRATEGPLKVVPGGVVTMSDISPQGITPFSLASANLGDIHSQANETRDIALNVGAAQDVLMGLQGDPNEALGSKRMRRESGVTRMNLTGMFHGRALCEIAEMFRDLNAQICAQGKTIMIGGNPVQINADTFLEMSIVEVVNIMRLASIQDDMVRAKEVYQAMTQNPLMIQQAQTGDLRGFWEVSKRFLTAYRERNIEDIIGTKPAPPPPPMPPQMSPPTGEPTEPEVAGNSEPPVPAPASVM